MKYGVSSRRATSHDVARLAGVSRTTVSFVLNDVSGIELIVRESSVGNAPSA